MLGRGVGNPATGAQGGDYPFWEEEEQQGWKQEGAPATYSAEEQEGLGAGARERPPGARGAAPGAVQRSGPEVGFAPGYNAPGYDDGDVPIDASDHYLAVDDSDIPPSYAQEERYEDEQEDAYEDDHLADDDLDNEDWDEELAESDADETPENRALVVAGERLPVKHGISAALSRLAGEPKSLALLQARVTGAIIVPGHNRPKRPGALGHSVFSPRAYRPRPFLMQIAVVLLAFTAIATTAFAMAPIDTESQILTGFTSLAGLAAPPAATTDVQFHWYVVHYGDSLNSIASQFKVLPGGILKMNGLHTADDLYVGLNLKIPTDPTYGADFQSVVNIPIPPPDKEGNRFGTSPWSSVAGPGDDANICAPAGNSDTVADRQAFQLINPNPGSSFARGFTWYHNGVDLDNPPGTTIVAAQAGLVLFAGWDVGGLGWSVRINHCNGLSTIYGHMANPPLVHAGDYVQVGQQIGIEGSTGDSTGPHLHMTVEWWNQYANPFCFDFNLPAGDTPCTN